eukprot:415346-Rhodomonas_salina.1
MKIRSSKASSERVYKRELKVVVKFETGARQEFPTLGTLYPGYCWHRVPGYRAHRAYQGTR